MFEKGLSVGEHLGDLLGLAEAMVALPVSALALRFSGPSVIARELGRVGEGTGTAAGPRQLASALRLGRVVRALSRRVYRLQCLHEALSLCWLLRRRGVHGKLRLGVRKPGSRELLAHAWVELDGFPLLDGPDLAQFQPFPALVVDRVGG